MILAAELGFSLLRDLREDPLGEEYEELRSMVVGSRCGYAARGEVSRAARGEVSRAALAVSGLAWPRNGPSPGPGPCCCAVAPNSIFIICPIMRMSAS